jgi:hypothetical protein
MKTIKIYMLSGMVILVMSLAACNKSSNHTNSTSNTSATNGGQGNINLSQVNMLLVGTLKLEDTDKAVSAEEAVNLLPLWQAYRSLSTSQTTAEAEVDALLNQIQSTMTVDQIQAIKDMNLTSTDMMDLMQSLGGAIMISGTPNPQSTPGINIAGGLEGGSPPSVDFQFRSEGSPNGSTGGTTRTFPSGGVVIVGGGPGGDAGSAAGLGGGPVIQGTLDPSMQATAQARFSTQANQVNTMLLDVLITKLEAKTTN